MSDIVAIEFDHEKFQDVHDCEIWLRAKPEYQYLLQNRLFRLTTNVCRYLSDEKRKVWGWYRTWQPVEMRSERPNRHIAIVKIIGSQQWTSLDLPAPLPATEEKRKREEFRKLEVERKRKERLAMNRLKRQEKNRLKAPKPTKKPKPVQKKRSHPKSETEKKSLQERVRLANQKKSERLKAEYGTDEEDPEFIKLSTGALSPLGDAPQPTEEELQQAQAAAANLIETRNLLDKDPGNVVVI